LGDAHKGTLEIDLKMMNQFVPQPQDVQDFYIACRAALGGANPAKEVAAVCQKFNRRKLGGPMLGDITDESVTIWMHLPEPVALGVTFCQEGSNSVKRVKSTGTDNYQFIHCEGLLPDTTYVYEVVINASGELLGKGRFTTAPTEATKKPLRIAFGADFHKIGLHRPELMRLVQERGNRAMVLIGDSAVDDRQNDFALIKADYLLRDLSPAWQRLSADVPIYAAWDDHDYFNNDRSGAFSVGGKPILVEPLRQIWKQQWNNPERDITREGIYFQTRIGPVHLIVLDTRSCREADRRGQLNSYLGEVQMTWLKKHLSASKASYILLSSGTMWSDYITPGKDSWGTWDTEGREAIFQLIDQKQDSQVILLSGDRHGARGFAMPRPGNRKLYEFEVGTLGGVPGPESHGSNTEDQLFGYPGSDTWAFGEFTFETKDGRPQVTFRLINEKGKELETISPGK
jgi:alkaline phosphatase D